MTPGRRARVKADRLGRPWVFPDGFKPRTEAQRRVAKFIAAHPCATANDIGEALGMTRNAAMGQISRMGGRLSERQEKPAPTVDGPFLPSSQCAFPIGNPGEADFHFCGAKAEKGKPYCAEHCGVCYQPMSKNWMT